MSAPALLALGLTVVATPVNDGLHRPGAWAAVRVHLDNQGAEGLRCHMGLHGARAELQVAPGTARDAVLRFIARRVAPRSLDVRCGDTRDGVVLAGWHEVAAPDVVVGHLASEAELPTLPRPRLAPAQLDPSWLLAVTASAWVVHPGVEVPETLRRFAAAGGVVVKHRPQATASESKLGRGRLLTRPSQPTPAEIESWRARPAAGAFPSPPPSRGGGGLPWLSAWMACALMLGFASLLVAARHRRRVWIAPATLIALAMAPLPGKDLDIESSAIHLQAFPQDRLTLVRASYRVRSGQPGIFGLPLHPQFDGDATRGRSDETPAPWKLAWGEADVARVEGFMSGVWNCRTGPGLPLGTVRLQGLCEDL